MPNSFESFVRIFFTAGANGEPVPQGIIYEVDDVGILFLTDLRPGKSATAHFQFWDRRFKGREELCRRMLRYAFDKFGFHRIIAEVGLYAVPEMAAVERVGFKKEGRMREATKYQGEWFDVNLYSILEHEVEHESAREHSTADLASHGVL